MESFFRPILVSALFILLVACDGGKTQSNHVETQPQQPDTLVSTDDMQTGAADFDRVGHPGRLDRNSGG